MNPNHSLSRRKFIGVSAAALCLARAARATESEVPRVGVCGEFKSAERAKAAGADYVEERVGRFLMPDRTEAEFRDELKQAQAAVLPIYSCNYFLPATLKSVGAEAAHDQIVKYATTTFERAQTAGIKIIVFGSAESRRIPDGFPRAEAVKQMVGLCRRLAEPAARNGVTVAIEPINSRYCNFLTRLDEIVGIVTAVGHPAVAITADFTHMVPEGDGMAECERAAKWIRHVHTADNDKIWEVLPPCLRILKQHRYAGRISFEGKWTAAAVDTIRQQWRAAL